MPATVTVKNIPDTTLAQLKQRAQVNHRSLNGEILHNLEKIVSTIQIDSEKNLAEILALRKRIKPNNITAAQIVKAIRQGRS